MLISFSNSLVPENTKIYSYGEPIGDLLSFTYREAHMAVIKYYSHNRLTVTEMSVYAFSDKITSEGIFLRYH